MLVRISYALYALRTTQGDPAAIEAIRPYAQLIEQPGASCGAPEFIEEALANDALNHDRFAEAELHFTRALALIDAEPAHDSSDDWRINAMVRRAMDQVFLSRAALGLHALDRARARLAEAKQSLESLSREATRFPQLTRTVDQFRNYVRIIEQAIMEVAPASSNAIIAPDQGVRPFAPGP